MEEMIKFIVFKLKNQSYGVDVQQVLSIERTQEITAVPRTSAFIKGVIQLRGEMTPIIDLKERLQLGETEKTDANRILVVQLDDIQVGLIVDSASEVIDIDPAVIEPAPKIIGEIQETFLKGVAKLEERLLILLDLEKILDFNETNEVREIIEE
ncbi:purine-binding chemotaxis protein CheW [Virgibacillus natechei]|uniref:Purine-binding chemotaxis protein CheW n=1 Tax=Virgibacillus natechei TaxID=1216297 RepID=A0ABS4IKY2_9BACI|nr:chemotaxis protein CheW [Virgibacillus natechei]MBP1971210.1 purine-binding chemotaxis protein CheW [Virgibacillus natechei]UZD11958.1 chemotaxis protein CheW [Virgibacillus natechei]